MHRKTKTGRREWHFMAGIQFPKFHFGVLVKRDQAGVCFRTNIPTAVSQTASGVFMYMRLEVLIPVTYPGVSHSAVGHKAYYRMVCELQPSLHVIN